MIVIKKFVHKNINVLSIFFLLIVSIVYMKLWFSGDESFTLHLIDFNYGGLLYHDSLDVHPPLYYILLKFIVSPFRDNFIHEVIVGRLFSLVTSLISVLYLKKIIEYLGLKMKFGYSLFIFLLIPNVIGIDNMNLSPLLMLRMYSLAGMFVIMTFYYCIKFRQSDSLLNLFFILIFSECAAYTHYYAAFMVGIMMISYFVYFAYIKNYDKAIKLCISGILVIVGYIPWILYGMARQFKDLPYGQPFYKFAIEVIFAIMLIVLFTIPLYKLYEKVSQSKKIDIIILMIVNIVVLLMTSAYSLFKNPIFLFRYLYPSLIIIEFIGFSYFVYNVFYTDKKVKGFFMKSSLLVCVILIPIFSGISLIHEIVRVQPISMAIYKNDMKISESKEKYIDLGKISTYVKPYDINGSMVNYHGQYSMFVKHLDKVPFVTDKTTEKIDNGFPNVVMDIPNVTYKRK